MSKQNFTIKSSDYNNLKYHVCFVNHSSRTQFSSLKDCKILEMASDTIDTELPQRQCALGHKVTLYLSEQDGDMSAFIEKGPDLLPPSFHAFEATVTDFKNTQNNLCEVKFKIHGDPDGTWKKLFNKLSEHQDNLGKFLKKLKI